ncbi:alpha/beta-hydrolase [Amylocystis lapponica]|nr:alpha/beta-hydrolase [Amylocystis lapponica]
MPVNTASAAARITPVVLKTLLRHARNKGKKVKDGDHTVTATDDIFFDEAFHIVKAFIQLGTENTIESLQAFTNTHVPAPPWATVSPVVIPFASCNKAAEALIEWFGPQDLKSVVGGEKWWQVRGLDGIDSEWITENKFISNTKVDHSGNLTESEKAILRMEHLDRVMLYVHGGAYFWGSINTHRYQVIRYARKFKGRAFAVNYRKAPQYPWPCPLQDVIAAYFYLTNPPPGAVHKPVHPSKLIFAGDSAGAGLCLTVLTVLRDLGMPQPAGAVLISPWVDLTHSFPSVMNNVGTDIIPPHGFIHKPSPLWPVESLPEEGRSRVIPTQTSPPPKPGHADTLKPSDDMISNQVEERREQRREKDEEVHTRDLQEPESKVGSQADMLQQPSVGGTSSGVQGHADSVGREDEPDYDAALDFWEPKPPKVFMNDPATQPLELRSQIQMYAMTEQLTHPLVSPILQSSLGNLCPLYIIAGDGEVLRDEIIYLAHKAAHPSEYPTRMGVLKDGRRQRENLEKFQTPTKVHLQVFDGMCHVLTVFTFTESAKYAYRSIAEFVKHVTGHSAEHLDRNPFPELHLPPSDVSDSDSEDEAECHDHDVKRSPKPSTPTGVRRYKENEEKTKEEVNTGDAEKMPEADIEADDRSSKGSGKDISRVILIRERVDVFGHVRPMEPKEELEALCMPPGEIGIIKEAPVKRWLAGQEMWDKKFKYAAQDAMKRRRRYEEKAARLCGTHATKALLTWMTLDLNSREGNPTRVRVESDRLWGPLDLGDEKPPPSAIAGRRDTREAVALLKKNIYHTAPATHLTVPKLKTMDALRAAFDNEDHPTKGPQQSEQQRTNGVPTIHGMRIWQSLLTYFMHRSSRKAVHGKEYAASAIRTTGKKLQPGTSEGTSPSKS